jgi:protein-tyrosine-phosphatase
MQHPFRILFLCTGNSARSILAEAICRARGGERVEVSSAGSKPRGAPHPMALAVLRDRGLPTEGLASKSWDLFAGPDAPAFDLVVTVCDSAAAEPCPVFPGPARRLHWSLPDPAAVQGTEAEVRAAFEAVADELERRIGALLEAPGRA